MSTKVKYKVFDRQKFFNKTARHLLKQNAKALKNKVTCVYLDEKTGNQCALGCHIPPSKYRSSLEGDGIWGRAPQLLNAMGYRPALSIHVGSDSPLHFMASLQRIHDGHHVDEWPDRLRSFAREHNLTLPPCLQQK